MSEKEQEGPPHACLGLFQVLVGLGLGWGALSSGIGAGPWREGLTFQVAHVGPHPLFFLLVPNLGIEALFQAPQGRLCLPKPPLKVHAYFHFGLHRGMSKMEEKYRDGQESPSSMEGLEHKAHAGCAP